MEHSLSKRGATVTTACVLAIGAVAIDYIAGWADLEFVRHNDLVYLPSIIAVLTIGWLYKKNLKAAAVGTFVAIVAAALLYLAAASAIEYYEPYSTLWDLAGPQIAYLFAPTLVSLYIGSFVASSISMRKNEALRVPR